MVLQCHVAHFIFLRLPKFVNRWHLTDLSLERSGIFEKTRIFLTWAPRSRLCTESFVQGFPLILTMVYEKIPKMGMCTRVAKMRSQKRCNYFRLSVFNKTSFLNTILMFSSLKKWKHKLQDTRFFIRKNIINMKKHILRLL